MKISEFWPKISPHPAMRKKEHIEKGEKTNDEEMQDTQAHKSREEKEKWDKLLSLKL